MFRIRPFFRAAVLLLLAVLTAAGLFSSCGSGIPSDAREGASRMKESGFPNEITNESYKSGDREDGALSVLLYADAEMKTFLQAIRYGTEAEAEAAFSEKQNDELLQKELEEEENVCVRAGVWILIGPQEGVDAFRGTKASETSP